MKTYIAPELTKTAFSPSDVIAASPLLEYLNENDYGGKMRQFEFSEVE